MKSAKKPMKSFSTEQILERSRYVLKHGMAPPEEDTSSTQDAFKRLGIFEERKHGPDSQSRSVIIMHNTLEQHGNNNMVFYSNHGIVLPSSSESSESSNESKEDNESCFKCVIL